MKNNLKTLVAIFALGFFFTSCKKTDYEMGDLTAPANVAINATLKGQSTAMPNGDGSGEVEFTVTGDNILATKIDYDAADGINLEDVPMKITKKYTTEGTNNYRVTVVAYGKGGTSTSLTKEIMVRSDFSPSAEIVTNLTGTGSKTWVIDKTLPGHMGVGPFGSNTAEWWNAAPNEKAACCNCFYTATFKFTKVSASSYTLQVTSPDGAFTKTGNLTTLPGIPATGDEGCYNYAGATSAFSFGPATSGTTTANSTRTTIKLVGNSTYIGYGATAKDYEILQSTADFMYLRVQGTETGNAWYLKLKAI